MPNNATLKLLGFALNAGILLSAASALAKELPQGVGFLRTISLPDAARNGVPQSVRDHASRISEVALNPTVFPVLQQRGASSTIGAHLSFKLFPDVTLEATTTQIEEGTDGYETLHAEIVSPSPGWMTITRGKGGTSGSIEYGGRQFAIGSANGKLFAKELLPYDAGVSLESVVIKANGPAKQPAPLRFDGQKNNPSRRLDIMVVYTAAAKQYLGGDPAPTVNNLVASLNGSFTVSGVDGWARLVRLQEVPSGTNIPNPLNQASFEGTVFSMTAGISSTYGDWSWLPSARSTWGADIVVLMTYAQGTNQQLCGIATQLTSETTTPANNAHVIVAANCVGNDKTFAHEIGHILGGRHDRQSYTSIGEPVPLALAEPAYGFADYDAGIRTIMGSSVTSAGTCGVSGCPRLSNWSDPFAGYFVPSPWGGYLINLGSYDTNMKVVLNGGSVGGPTYASSIAQAAQYVVPTGPAPTTPSGLSSFTGQLIYNASWNASNGNVGWYELESGTDAAFASATIAYRGSNTTARIQNKCGMTLRFRVRACNAAACSGYSNVAGPATACSP